MALATASDRHLSAGNGTLETLRARFATWRARRAAYRVTRDELMRLSDRDLADLGIHRSNITRIALEAAQEI